MTLRISQDLRSCLGRDLCLDFHACHDRDLCVRISVSGNQSDRGRDLYARISVLATIGISMSGSLSMPQWGSLCQDLCPCHDRDLYVRVSVHTTIGISMSGSLSMPQ